MAAGCVGSTSSAGSHSSVYRPDTMDGVHPLEIPSVEVADVPADGFLLDVREDDEWDGGHADIALHIPMNDVPRAVGDDPDALPSERRVHVVCKAGGRSAQVTGWLRGHGVDAVNVTGGMLAWQQAGRTMITDDGHPPTVV